MNLARRLVKVCFTIFVKLKKSIKLAVNCLLLLLQILPKRDHEENIEVESNTTDESEKDDEDDSAIYDKFGKKIKS